MVLLCDEIVQSLYRNLKQEKNLKGSNEEDWQNSSEIY